MPDQLSCVYCKLRDGLLPSIKIYETPTSFAILDAFPSTEGHTVVISKIHYPRFIDMPETEVPDYLIAVHRVARAVEKATGRSSQKVENFSGPETGGTVPHLHFHIIPRSENDDVVISGKNVWWARKPELFIEDYKKNYKEKMMRALQELGFLK